MVFACACVSSTSNLPARCTAKFAYNVIHAWFAFVSYGILYGDNDIYLRILYAYTVLVACFIAL